MDRYRIMLWVGLLVAVPVLSACNDLVSGGEFEEEVVVEAYLVAHEALPEIRLSRTAELNTSYNFEDRAVRDATVRMHLLAEDGSPEATYAFTSSAQSPGVYRHVDWPIDVPPVRSLRQYQLEADVPGFGTVTATTLVPDTFSVVRTNANEVVYQGGTQFEATVTRSTYPNRQAYFIFTTRSLEPTLENLTPVYRDLFDEEEDSIEEFRISRSPILNEATYAENEDGTISIRLPWIAVPFYGRNQVAINALDDNMYDYIRTLDVQQGGSTLGPGEIPNVLDHVENGRGIFGSYARVSRQIAVQRTSMGF